MLPEQERSILGIFRLHGITVLGDLWDGVANWRVGASFRQSTHSSRHGNDSRLAWLLSIISRFGPPFEIMCLQNCNGWAWLVGKNLIHKLSLPNATWSFLLSSLRTDYSKLNHRWEANFVVGT